MEPEGPHSVEYIDEHRYHAIRVELKVVPAPPPIPGLGAYVKAAVIPLTILLITQQGGSGSRSPATSCKKWHNLAAVPVFFGLPAAAASYGWRSWRAVSRPVSRSTALPLW